jgi:hypothetical protein
MKEEATAKYKKKLGKIGGRGEEEEEEEEEGA